MVWQGHRCKVQEVLQDEGEVTQDDYDAAVRALALAAEFGPSHHPARVKKIRSSSKRLWELCPTKHLRVTCTLAGRQIVLLTAFYKTKQKTPKNEIDRAERLRRQLEDEGVL